MTMLRLPVVYDVQINHFLQIWQQYRSLRADLSFIQHLPGWDARRVSKTDFATGGLVITFTVAAWCWWLFAAYWLMLRKLYICYWLHDACMQATERDPCKPWSLWC